MNPAHICAEFERVVANDLCPVVDHIHVRFTAYPGQRCGIADERVAAEVGQKHSNLAAGELADIDARDADGGRIAGTIVSWIGGIAIMSHADTRLRKEGARKRPVIIQAGAVYLLRSRSCEGALR